VSSRPITACFLNAGQSCTAGERVLVHRSVHDAYVEQLLDAVRREVRLGDPLDPTTTMGPVNNLRTADKTESHIRDAVAGGASLETGGDRRTDLGSSLFFEPTVLDMVTESMAIAREETFGPVVPITTIDDESEALAIVESSGYGLLTSVFTRDMARGLKFAESARAGWVNINEGTNNWESHLPEGRGERGHGPGGPVGGGTCPRCPIGRGTSSSAPASSATAWPGISRASAGRTSSCSRRARSPAPAGRPDTPPTSSS
jgi:acyl-CoA reductase-like NAD-dependent aldehyde dehydrogenase